VCTSKELGTALARTNMSQVNDRRPLLEEEDDDDSSADLQINSRFAQQYELRKQREELTRYKRNEGSDDSDSSSLEEEDEDGALLTTRLDVDILKTIHAIRTKDPKIYNPNVQFFHEEEGESDKEDDTDAKVQSRPSKPKKRYQDIVREQILEKMNSEGDLESDDEDSHAPGRNRASYDASRLAYDEQQQQVRQEFLQSMQDMEEEEFVPLRKTKPLPDGDDDDEEAREAFAKELVLLKGLRASSTGNKTDSSDWKDPRGEVSNGYDYLLQYFEKRPWKKNEKDDTPVDDDDDDAGDASSLPDVEQADAFEATYNFRYETAADDIHPAPDDGPREPASGADHSNISYARSLTMETLRRKDDRRVQKRQERLERKAQERKMKEEQLKRLKNAKRQELNQKLQQIRSVLGPAKEGESDESHPPMHEAAILKLLEEDFDPEKFESIMAGICSDEYYNQNDTEWKNDLDVRKSLQSGMEEDGALLVGPDDGDGGLYDTVPEMDDDDVERNGVVPEPDDEDWLEEEEWQEDTLEHAMERKIKAKMEEELYKLDYEDIVAGIPTRFKYRSVPANNYGLSTMEILCARDTTLKQYVSLKKLAPYVDQEYVVRPKKRQKFRQLVRQEIEELVETEAPKKKRHKKGKATAEEATDTPLLEPVVPATHAAEPKFRQLVQQEMEELVETEAPKKKRRKKGKATAEEAVTHAAEPQHTAAEGTVETKTKRQRRKKVRPAEDGPGDAKARGPSHRPPRSVPPAADARLAAYGL
jgi:protein KRI1